MYKITFKFKETSNYYFAKSESTYKIIINQNGARMVKVGKD